MMTLVHVDEATMHMMQLSLHLMLLHYCNITFSVF